MRVILIHNPGAGQHAAADLERLLAVIAEAGHEARYQSCTDDGWESALDEPADLVAIAGGDGTVTRVLKKLAGRRIPVAPLPAGTANNVATALGIVGRPVEELVRGWAQARHAKLDLGVAQGPWGRRRFVEGIGVGLFANTVPAAGSSPELKALKAPADKVKFALRRLAERLERTRAVSLKASLDGEDVSGDYVLFEAMNIPYIGPNLYLAPDSRRGDGQFDLVMVSEAERERLLHYLETWQEQRKRLAVLPTRQGRRLHIEWSGFPVHLDDEFWPAEGERPAAASVIEVRLDGTAVDVLVPPRSPST